MKNFMILGLAVAFSITACKKSSDDDGGTPSSAIGPVPATFTTKVMVEENTGAWCGWCVLGAEGIKKAEDTYPERVNAVALHGGGSNEPMTVPEYAGLISFSGATGVPHYRLNRGVGGGFPGSFSSNVASALGQASECGLAIDASKSNGNEIEFTVHAGFKSALTDDLRLLVYLVEDSVKNSASSYNQQNFVAGNSSYTSSYYYSQPATITNYPHKHVARKLLSASLEGGDQIPAASVLAGKSYTKTYTFTVPASSTWNVANLRVVAGILKYDADCTGQDILNSQSVLVGETQDWD